MAIVLNETSGITTPNIVANAGNIASPVFTGNPVAPTPSSGDKDATLATTAYANSLLVEYEVTGSAVTSINFTGLDINTHKSYRIEVEAKNATATPTIVSMFVNNDTVATNYYCQYLVAGGTAVAGARANSANIFTKEASAKTNVIGNVSLVDGYMYSIFNSAKRDPSSIEIQNYSMAKTATVTNITQLTFTSSVANSIAVGSRIRIYRGDV